MASRSRRLSRSHHARRRAVVGETLELLRRSTRAGITTGELDRLAAESIRAAGAVPSFLGYGHPPFPATICVSVNDEVVHGIPGDRVSETATSSPSTAARSSTAGTATPRSRSPWARSPAEALELMRVTEESMWRGIAAAALGGRVGDISHAVESHVRGASGFGIVEDYTGHGIGSAMHQPPNVPNVGRPRQGRPPGRGPGARRRADGHRGAAVDPVDDGWTVATEDGSLAAHFEHTFTITPAGAWVLTALDGGAARLAELGVPYGGRMSADVMTA